MEQTMPYPHFSWYHGIVRERNDSGYATRSKRKKPATAAAVHQPHDKGYKSLLSSKKVFLELLRSFVKQDWVEQMDEADLVKLDASYVSADFRGQSSDLVYRAKLRRSPEAARSRRKASSAPREVWFYVLLEMQSTIDALMLFRLLCYMTELWRDIVKNAGEEAYKQGFTLPVIVPIVLYNGKRSWKAPLRFRDKLDRTDVLGGDTLDFPYVLIDIRRFDPEELLRQGNVIGSVFLLDQVEELDAILQRLSLLADTLRKLNATEWRLFWNWTKHILGRNLRDEERAEVERMVQQSKPEEAEAMITNIEKAVKRARQQDRREGKLEGKIEGKKEGKIEGKIEGKSEGRVEGKLEVAEKLLAAGMPFAEVVRVVGLPEDVVRTAVSK